MIKFPSFFYKPLNIFLFFFIIYAIIAFLPKPSGMTLTNGDEPHYLVMTYNLIHKGNIEHLEKVYAKKIYKSWYGADEIEGHLIALPQIKNKVYAYHQIGLSILLIPGFAVGGLYGSVLTLVALMSLGIVFMYKTLLYYVDKTWALTATIVTGLSLPVGTYANLIYPETPIFCIVAILMMIILHKNFRLHIKNILIIAFLLAYLPVLHIKFIVISILFLIYLNLLPRKKNGMRVFLLNALVVLGISGYMIWFNSYYDWRYADAMSAIAAGTKLSLFEIPSGLLGVLVDRENGFLIYSPFYIYLLFGIIPLVKKSLSHSWRKAIHTLFPLILTAAFTGFYTMFPYVMGGASPSGRYSLPVVPAMAVLVALGFQAQSRTKLQRTFLYLISLYSIMVFAFLSWNPLLAMPGQMENKLFFFIFQGNAHRLINAYLPNLSKYHRVIPLIDYVKGIGVFLVLVLISGWGNFSRLTSEILLIKKKK